MPNMYGAVFTSLGFQTPAPQTALKVLSHRAEIQEDVRADFAKGVMAIDSMYTMAGKSLVISPRDIDCFIVNTSNGIVTVTFKSGDTASIRVAYFYRNDETKRPRWAFFAPRKEDGNNIDCISDDGSSTTMSIDAVFEYLQRQPAITASMIDLSDPDTTYQLHEPTAVLTNSYGKPILQVSLPYDATDKGAAHYLDSDKYHEWPGGSRELYCARGGRNAGRVVSVSTRARRNRGAMGWGFIGDHQRGAATMLKRQSANLFEIMGPIKLVDLRDSACLVCGYVFGDWVCNGCKRGVCEGCSKKSRLGSLECYMCTMRVQPKRKPLILGGRSPKKTRVRQAEGDETDNAALQLGDLSEVTPEKIRALGDSLGVPVV
ncbi:MAG: hypothetical protein CL902_00920 [Dehalococcoidia bacterium]|nr:hypothetical protein [Dehalococcoidia bacterium]